MVKVNPICKPLGLKLSKLDESRLLLAAALAGISKSQLARQGINEIVGATLRRAATELAPVSGAVVPNPDALSVSNDEDA